MAVGQEPCGLILTPVIKEGSDPRFTANSEFAGMLPKMGSDPAGSDPNFTRLNSVGILVD